MEVKFTDKDLKIESIKNGIGLGLITLVLGIVSAYLIINTTSMWAIFIYPVCLGVILPIVLAVFFCIDLRKKIGGYWNFRKATSGIFIMFLFAYIISSGLNVAYSKIVEPNLESKIENSVMNATINMMEKQGVDQSKIDEVTEKRKEDSEKKKKGTVMQNIQGYAIGVIFVFIFALIFGAIFKKEKPLFFNNSDNTQVDIE